MPPSVRSHRRHQGFTMCRPRMYSSSNKRIAQHHRALLILRPFFLLALVYFAVLAAPATLVLNGSGAAEVTPCRSKQTVNQQLHPAHVLIPTDAVAPATLGSALDAAETPVAPPPPQVRRAVAVHLPPRVEVAADAILLCHEIRRVCRRHLRQTLDEMLDEKRKKRDIRKH